MSQQIARLAPIALALAAVGTARGAQTSGTLNFRDVTSSRVVMTVSEADGPNMKAVAAGDFDQDGDPDVALAIAAGTYGSRVNKMYRNDGGVFVEVTGAPIVPELALSEVSRHVAFEDFDGDGWLDLVLVNDSFEHNDPVRLFVNKHAGGTFSHFEEEGTARGLGWDWACGAVAADFDHDGDMDLLTANYGSLGQDVLYTNQGGGFFVLDTPTHVPTEADFSIDAAAGDINGDGKIDLLIGNDGAPFYVYYNDNGGQGDQGVGDYRYGTGGTAGVFSLGTSPGHGALEPADFDGDGRVDIYWTNRTGAAGDEILRNTGNAPNGMAIFETVIPPAFVRSVASRKATVADLNADGRVDVMVMTADRPAILRNTSVNGVISFVDWTPASAFPSGFVHAGMHAEALDSNSDGDLDVFLGGTTGDHLFENVPSVVLAEDEIVGGHLPTFMDGEPLAIRGSASPGAADSYDAGALGSDGFLAAVLNSADDTLLEVLRNGVLVGSSDRAGLGGEEALQVPLDSGLYSIRVTVQSSGAGNGSYVLETLARQDSQSNDDCTDARVLTLGDNPFTNVGATTDGLAHPLCDQFGDDQVPADVWFDFLAPQSGTLTVTTCGTANFDTKLAVYSGRECPATTARLLGCNEDTNGCAGFTSTVVVQVDCGEWYKVRVGGFLGAQGAGILGLSLQGSGSSCATYPYCFGAGCPCGNDDPFAGCANATGAGADLSASGSVSLANDDLVLSVSGTMPGQFGLVYVGGQPTEVAFGDGLGCVASGATGTHRFPVRSADASGAFAEGPGLAAFSLANFPPAGALVAGSTFFFQGWYRDPGGPCGNAFNLTNGLAATFQP